jgi:hypothetical protein
MQSPYDSTSLKPISEHIFQDESEGWFLTNLAAIREKFDGKIQQLNTREMKLDTLGEFPLAKNSLPLLQRKLMHEGIELTVNEMFARSHIPIYSDKSGSLAYIPTEGANICRYFYDLWRFEDDIETDPVIAGFAVLASYAGL